MIITFSDGRRIEGRIYTQTDSAMRVAVQGAEDLLDFTCISGQWVSENCEPVGVEFAWQHGCLTEIVEEGDCICSQELASLLINRLLSEADEPEMTARASGVDRT